MNLPADLCTFDDIEKTLSPPFDELRALRLSTLGRFVPYRRLAGRQSPPVFNRIAVANWYRNAMQELLPRDTIEANVANFLNGLPDTPTTHPKKKTR